MKSTSSIKILNVEIDNLSSKKVLEEIEKSLSSDNRKLITDNLFFHIVTINPEFVMLAQKDEKFKNILNSAQLRVPDGVGIIWAGKILGKKFAERTTGLFLLKNLVKISAEQGLTIGLIGGKDKIALKTGKCLEKLYPKLKWWSESGPEIRIQNSEFRIQNEKPQFPQYLISNIQYLDSKSKKSYNFEDLTKKINETQTRILFCAFGAPKQEYFINHLIYNSSLITNNCMVTIGVGGAFDEITGNTAPAPLWLDKIGLKWLWRLLNQPWRFRRQLNLIKFVYLVLKSKYK